MPYTPFSVCIRPLEEDDTEKKKKKDHPEMGNCIVSKKTKARDKQIGKGSTGGLTVTNVNAKEYSW